MSNDLVFSGEVFAEDDLVDKIQFSPWYWFFKRRPGSPCSHHEWMMEHVLCWSL